MKKAKSSDTALTYETSLKQLEGILQKLEDTDTSLEDSLSAFEEGIGLVKEVQNMLRLAEQKVMLLSEDGDEPSLKPFGDDEETE